MFFLCGGKKGLPWGSLKTHREIAAAKNDQLITNFLNQYLSTEYGPLIPTLSQFLKVCRDRTRSFTWVDHHNLYREFETLLHFCGWTFDRNYDWCAEWDSQTTVTNEQHIFHSHIQ